MSYTKTKRADPRNTLLKVILRIIYDLPFGFNLRTKRRARQESTNHQVQYTNSTFLQGTDKTNSTPKDRGGNTAISTLSKEKTLKIKTAYPLRRQSDYHSQNQGGKK